MTTYLLPFACHKPSPPPDIVSGIVTDKKTSDPITDAFIYCSGKKGTVGHEYFKDFSVRSDSVGQFVMIIPEEYSFSIFSVTKEGFLPNIHPDRSWTFKGDTFYLDIQLVSTDGYFQIKLENISGKHDSIYVKIISPTEIEEGLGVHQLKKFPVIIQSGDIYIEKLAFPSEEKLYIYWDYNDFSNTNAQFRDSIYLPPNIISEYLLKY